MSNSDVFWVGGVKSKGGNDGIGDNGGDSSWDWGKGCQDGGAIKLVWITGVLNCVELLAPWDRLFLKLHRVFGDNGGERGMTGELGLFGVWTVESGWEFE